MKFNTTKCIDQYAGLMGISKAAAKKQFMTAMDVLYNAILFHEGATIPGYFSLTVSTRPARMGRNPATGETVEIPEKRYVKIKLSDQLSKQLNK